MLYMTEEAARWIFMQLDVSEARSMRVSVKPAGCNGYKYEFDLVKAPADDDVIVCQGGARVVIDPVSAVQLHGATIILEETPFKKQLKIINPNVKGQCGCGESFSL